MSEGEEKSMIERERDAVREKMAQYKPPPVSVSIVVDVMRGGFVIRAEQRT